MLRYFIHIILKTKNLWILIFNYFRLFFFLFIYKFTFILYIFFFNLPQANIEKVSAYECGFIHLVMLDISLKFIII